MKLLSSRINSLLIQDLLYFDIHSYLRKRNPKGRPASRSFGTADSQDYSRRSGTINVYINKQFIQKKNLTGYLQKTFLKKIV